MQAALAADFSMTQFNYLGRLLLVHGRYRFVDKHSLRTVSLLLSILDQRAFLIFALKPTLDCMSIGYE